MDNNRNIVLQAFAPARLLLGTRYAATPADSVDGAIGSLVSDLLNPTTIIIREENVSGSVPPIYVLVSNWSMDIVNGEINYLHF